MSLFNARQVSTVRVVAAGLVSASLLAFAAPAPAQTTLEVMLVPEPVPGQVETGAATVFLVNPDGPRVLSSTPLTAAQRERWEGAYTSDGRFNVYVRERVLTPPYASYTFVISDLVSGGTIELPSERSAFRIHPRRTEIVTRDSGGPVVLAAAGPRRLGGCGDVSDLSADGTRAVFTCGLPPAHTVVDVDTGAVVRQLGVSIGPYPVLSPNGRDAYDFDGGALRRRSVATGAELARVSISGEDTVRVTLRVDPRTGDVLVFGTRLWVFDGETLVLERVGSGSGWLLDPTRPRLYDFVRQGDQMSFVVFDTDTLQTISSTPIPPGSLPVAMRRVPTPAAPTQLAATVQGAAVTLSWAEGAPVAQTLRYVLEVGSAPGRNDIFSGLDVGLQTSFGASNVPPGTYYVRVRAGNYSGLGAPSNEVVVQVP